MKGGGWPHVCEPKVADLIRRVGQNEWRSTLDWCSRDPVWVRDSLWGPGSDRSQSYIDRVCSLTLFCGSPDARVCQ